MKRLYWFFPAAILAGIAMLWWPCGGQAPQHDREKPPTTATAAGPLKFRVPTAAESVSLPSKRWTAHTPLGRDGRRASGEMPKLENVSSSHEVPAVFVAFDQWLRDERAASEDERVARLAEGRALLTARQELWPEFARRDPQAALLLAPSAVAREALPPDMAGQLEKVVAGEGIYGVLAVCNNDAENPHGEGCRIEYQAILDKQMYDASIYGTRQARMTEQKASIYGVALGKQIALHEDDVVIFPAEEISPDPARAGQLAIVYKGQTTFAADEAALPTILETLLNP